MRFTEYLSEDTPTAATPQSWTDRNPGHQNLDRPTNLRNATQPKASGQDPWETILKAAANPEFGGEFIMLLGAMYQAKRRNPAVVMSMPKMITNLPEDKVQLKQQMTNLFNLAKNDDEAHLAQRSQELQQARLNSVAKPGTNPTPGQMPPGQTRPQTGATKTSTANSGAMLQQLMQIINNTVPNLTTRQIKQASAALNAPLNKKRQAKALARRNPNTTTQVPQQAAPSVTSAG